ncbi:MAG: thioredoxin family protein [Parvularculaceae bacterium]
MKAFLLAFLAAIALGACAVAKTATSAAVSVSTAAVKTTASVTGDVAEAPFKGGGEADDEPRPFDETRDAMADVDAALAAATTSRKHVLLVLGGNWCHDSRGLAGKFEKPELARVIADGYELVFVDVGHRDRNLDVARRFGVKDLLGTPTVLILSADGELLNATSVHDWRTAASKSDEETLAYFKAYAGGAS